MRRYQIFLLGLILCKSLFAGEWPSYVHVYKGSTPTLDGLIEKGEYEDASVIEGVQDWNEQFSKTPVNDSRDLSIKCWVKHDGHNLYFAFDIEDDILYGIETERWVPDENQDKVHDFTKESFPWFGDGIELLINSSYTWPLESGKYNYGDARSWQVVCNHSKSLLGGIGKGGLIQGEQRTDPHAWENHEKWIRSGAMKSVTKVKKDKSGYVVEWMITPECLQVDKKKEIFWSPDQGIVRMGLNIGVQDLDNQNTAPENWSGFHHEVWWAGEKDYRTEPRQWGTMYIHPGFKKVTEIYVSPKGSDRADGTKEKPLATLNEAKRRVQKIKGKQFETDIAVCIMDGTYHITEPILFGKGDGGNDNNTVTYRAMEGHKPKISGGKEISGWERHEGNLWRTIIPEVKGAGWNFRTLYKDDRRLVNARYPNKDQQYLYIVDLNDEKDEIILPSILPKGDYTDAEIVVIHLWAESIAKIKSLNGDKLLTQNPVGFIGHGAIDARLGRKLYLQNSIEFMDTPGEYFLDRENGALYYMAAKGSNPNESTFIAPVVEKIIVISGTKSNPVKNLVFEGINFEFTNWLLPSSGFNEAQAGHWGERWDFGENTSPEEKNVAKGLPGAIELKYAENIRFENCRMAHTGAHGIALGAGTRENEILGSKIYDIAGNGVMVGQRLVPDNGATWFNVDWEDPNDAPHKNRISFNIIEKSAQVMHSCAGVFDAYAYGTSLTHNLITDLPYTGISLGFNWGYEPTSQSGTYVAFNEVSDIMQMMYDGGGIYTLGLQPGTVISNNYIHDVKNGHGIYTDEGSQQILFERNIVNGIGDCAYQHHHGHSNIFRNNIFADARVNYIRRLREDEEESFWMDRNIFWITGGRILNGTWANGLFKFTNNIYWITRGGYPLQFVDMTHGWIEDWQKSGYDVKGMFADPLFKNPGNGDFNMPESSPAIKAGFMPIYLENVGPGEFFRRKK